jgi:GT2 family glycosyltransferase
MAIAESNGAAAPVTATNEGPAPMNATGAQLAPALSIIVAATDHRPTLPRCLSAINVASAAHDELIVVQDGVLPGPASARNHGALAASAGILVFVDADVEVQPDALSLIRERFAGDPGIVAVFGSYDEDPEERDVISSFRNLLHHYVHQGAAGSIDSFWAGLGAVRRDAFEEIGGFDPCIARASVEDIEFGGRLRMVGRIELDPAVRGKHLKRWTLTNMLRTDLTRRGIPWTQLAISGSASRSALNLGWRHRLSAASSVAIAMSLARWRLRQAAAAAGILCLLNRRFYGLLRHRGRRYLVAGIGLHVVHHMTSVLAFVLGVLGMPWARRPSGTAGARTRTP